MKYHISNNGTVHYTQTHTTGWVAKLVDRVLKWSQYAKPAYPGYIRKLCDGQWVRDRLLPSSMIVNCDACMNAFDKTFERDEICRKNLR